MIKSSSFMWGNFDLCLSLSVSCHADEEDSSSTTGATGLSFSKKDHKKDQKPPSLPSSQNLKSSRADITTPDADTRLFSLIAAPPIPRGSKVKARCSTLPSRPRGSEACYSLPRPSHSTSLTRFQQTATLTPVGHLGSSLSANSNPFCPPQTPVSPSFPHLTQSQSDTEPKAPSELFTLKGPPPQQHRPRAKIRCFTLPPRQRTPGDEECTTKASHSTNFTKLEECIPPSPSALKRNTLV